MATYKCVDTIQRVRIAAVYARVNVSSSCYQVCCCCIRCDQWKNCALNYINFNSHAQRSKFVDATAVTWFNTKIRFSHTYFKFHLLFFLFYVLPLFVCVKNTVSKYYFVPVPSLLFIMLSFGLLLLYMLYGLSLLQER